ncbi:oligoendopeptidase F [Candidatus Protochlamydia naegleriophila]|uniref:Oligoendopeptidase F n=1 Tax=Candidatus Protochlamydia naegleriophila TaxID=389348 RepID=A0A0U5JEQ4_9BACT|nr:M3 family oligoendopeptidase [Candidatus Protochlamydia naegleriophila]CUI16373.1 oligoendopeptidase F [Candidatus Protochlamydia naegleriophila]
MSNHYSNRWELDSLFSGGSQSPALILALQTLKSDLEQMLPSPSAALHTIILALQDFDARCYELQALIDCLLSQNVNDEKAIQLQEQIVVIRALYENLSSVLDEYLSKLSESDFKQLLEHPDLQNITFSIQERREWNRELLPLAQEQLIHRLWINGYQGWNDMYEAFMGQFRIPFPDQAGAERLSVGQAENLLSHPDRKVRHTVFKEWEKTWSMHEGSFAQILNHLAGFRLQLYEARGWTSVLKEPLFCNRMQDTTLNSMWKAVERHKQGLVRYLNKRARLFDSSQLAWFDISAPLPQETLPFISFNEAAELIKSQFSKFSPRMGAFATKAFQNKWIEAEDREGKRAGGFCAHFPISQQSRIFMTYNGSMTNIFTLAHELGHAYHNEVVDPLPRFSQHYRMNVAETASTLCETIVIDSLIHQTTNLGLKTVLLDHKIQRAVVFLMNIHARFLFETRFYAERKKGFVLPSMLNSLMQEAQQEAFCNALSEWHPHFWVAKQHFYATSVPFYNFPYTFGYLFSLGIYAHLQQLGPKSCGKYDSLLADTGRMEVEKLAQKHLGVDLTQPDFWEKALELIEEDISKLLQII